MDLTQTLLIVNTILLVILLIMALVGYRRHV